jgi:hypothetical protein
VIVDRHDIASVEQELRDLVWDRGAPATPDWQLDAEQFKANHDAWCDQLKAFGHNGVAIGVEVLIHQLANLIFTGELPPTLEQANPGMWN